MSEDKSKAALASDNPPQQPDDGGKGLGTETRGGTERERERQDVTEKAPERRGEVRYPDKEDPDENRPTPVPKEGSVEEHA